MFDGEMVSAPNYLFNIFILESLPAEAGRFQIAGLILKRKEIGLTYTFFVTKLSLLSK
jgi:hypothetical protein